jgi:hypothetical protein
MKTKVTIMTFCVLLGSSGWHRLNMVSKLSIQETPCSTP